MREPALWVLPARLPLQSIFELLNSVYSELEDPASPHFQLCLSILETVSEVGAGRTGAEQTAEC